MKVLTNRMKHIARPAAIGFAAAALIGVAFAAPPAHAAATIGLPNGNALYSTGIAADGSALADFQADPHYRMTLNPDTGTSPLYVTNNRSYLSGNTAASQWLDYHGSAAVVDAPDAPTTYRAAVTVDLTGVNVGPLALHGYWLTDNTGQDIRVNGAPTGQTNTGSHAGSLSQPGNAFSLTAADGLIAGINTIEFEWINAPFGPTNPTHLRVEWTAAVPEPGTAASLVGFTVGLLVRRRPHRCAGRLVRRGVLG